MAKPMSTPTSAVIALPLANVTIFTFGSTYNVSEFIPYFKEYAVGAFNNTPGFVGMDITDASTANPLAQSRSTVTGRHTLNVVMYLNAFDAALANVNTAALLSAWDFIAVDQRALLAGVLNAMNAVNGGNTTLAGIYTSLASPTLSPVTMAPTALTGRFSNVIISTSGSTYDPNLFIPLFKDYLVNQFNFTPGFLGLAVTYVSSTTLVNGTTSQILTLAGTINLDPVAAAAANVATSDLKSSWDFIATNQQGLLSVLTTMNAQTSGTTMLAGATIAGSSTIAPTTFPTTVQPAVTPAPVTKAPTPVTASPVTKEPTASPITASPVTKAPTPVTASPVTKAPTASPITPSPVTKSPVTAAPTTAPTKVPTARPSKSPTTSAPSVTDQPSNIPSSTPSSVVSSSPSGTPSAS
jgi:hypothetical protein